MDTNAKQSNVQPQINQTPVPPILQPQTPAPPPAQPPISKSKFKSLMLLEVGLLEIGFVVLMLLIFFGVLNYFNIISLSSLYVNQLGWLPHITKSTNVSNNSQSSIPPQKPTPTPSTQNLDNAVTTILAPPTYTKEDESYSLESTLNKQNGDSITVDSYKGTLDFTLAPDTIYEVPPSSPDALILQKVTKAEFFKEVGIGKSITVVYKTEGHVWKLYFFGK
jgi:hypothetical protein